MPISEPPEDLIALRREFLAQEARHAELCRATAPDAERADAHRAQVAEAFNAMAETAATIARHGWFAQADNRYDAEKALRAVAG